MRIPIGWLREWADLPADATPEALHAALVRVGFEEETVHGGDVAGPVVVGQVLEFTAEPQKNGKTIRWCSVQVAPDGERAADGGGPVRGIVCGAANFHVGDKVVVTLPGAILPGPFPIAARKTYGHVSDGMIASSRELGVGEEHDGILRLAEIGLDPEVGTDAIVLLGLDDAAVEINVTPDRGYALSIRGIAREYGASTGAAFRDPALAVSPPTSTGGGSVSVRIDDATPLRGRAGAGLFVTRVVRGIDPAATTPRWMQARLRLSGIRPISLPVDITNYVMVELGQPLHGYDLDRLQGGLGVRRAEPGERLTTLDGQERALHPEDLVITDDSGAIGLAGVMGGATTELSGTTRNVVIEAATFDPVSIGRTARRHRLPSEASRRFERGVDPAVAAAAAERAAGLLVELAGGTAEPGQTVVGTVPEPAAILLAHDAVSARAGVTTTPPETVAALEAIGASVVEGADGADGSEGPDRAAAWTVTPPTWRGDLSESADLVEEVVRIVGYDRIPSVLPVAPPGRGLTRAQQLRRSVARTLAAVGAVEVQTYPFVVPDAQAAFTGDAPAMRIANPIDPAAPLLRRSLLPGLLDIVRRNRGRGLTDLALFETGTVFLPEVGVEYGVAELPPLGARPAPQLLGRLTTALPPQPQYVAAVFSGAQVPKQPGRSAESADWRDAIAAAHEVAAAVGLTLTIRATQPPGFHPGRAAQLLVGDEPVGSAGELLPALTEQAGIVGRVAAAELDLDALIRLADAHVDIPPISPQPAATQDLSLVVDVDVPAGSVLEAVIDGAGELLEHAALIDDYRGGGVPDGAKSLTFALRFRAPDRTLTAAEATAAKQAGAATAAARTGATLRE
ncbi:phenylalanine--tRNA ligase subunit beta [uncultured Amnibacterium sp.]|uniref:phenylalanine--tRNA ligase subunit beta n=1 Tax=uncultured Amnibacterium sp. TaxID=1631851 RepID=UPI0035CB0DC4